MIVVILLNWFVGTAVSVLLLLTNRRTRLLGGQKPCASLLCSYDPTVLLPKGGLSFPRRLAILRTVNLDTPFIFENLIPGGPNAPPCMETPSQRLKVAVSFGSVASAALARRWISEASSRPPISKSLALLQG